MASPNDWREDREQTPEGEGFQRRGWREGSDYYGNDPERYGAGNYDQFADRYAADERRSFARGSDEWFGNDIGWDELSNRGRGPRSYARSDERIREDACELLTDDPRVDASNLEVTVQDGEITLFGTVSSRMEKRIAEDLVADNVFGVKDVHNQLRVAVTDVSGGASPSARH